jgi:hypothetical protein
MKAIITKTVNSIAVEAEKGETFEIVKEFDNSFLIKYHNFGTRLLSKQFAEVQTEPTTKVKTGVISEIVSILKNGYVSKKQILETLSNLFPEKQTASMWNTINCQFSRNPETGLRIEREQKIKVVTKEKKGKKLFKLS